MKGLIFVVSTQVLSSPLPPHYAPHLNALVPGMLQHLPVSNYKRMLSPRKFLIGDSLRAVKPPCYHLVQLVLQRVTECHATSDIASPLLYCAGSADAADGQPPEEKSVLQALQDLGSHFGREGSFGAAPAAAAAPAADAGDDGPEPPRQRIGKVTAS